MRPPSMSLKRVERRKSDPLISSNIHTLNYILARINFSNVFLYIWEFPNKREVFKLSQIIALAILEVNSYE